MVNPLAIHQYVILTAPGVSKMALDLSNRKDKMLKIGKTVRSTLCKAKEFGVYTFGQHIDVDDKAHV
jgi:hypothetical protein